MPYFDKSRVLLWAQKAVSLARDRFKKNVEISYTSLKDLDEVLSQISVLLQHHHVTSGKTVENLALYFGALLGEILRQEFDGEWMVKEGGQIPYLLIQGVKIRPMEYVWHRLRRKNQWSVKEFYDQSLRKIFLSQKSLAKQGGFGLRIGVDDQFEEQEMNNNLHREKKGEFNPKLLTILGGASALIGTAFGWLERVYCPLDSTQPPFYIGEPRTVSVQTGLSTAPGMVVAIVSILVIVTTLFWKSEPGRPNALPAALLSLAAFLMSCWWCGTTPTGCLHGDSYALQLGGGCTFSVLALLLTFFFGLIPSPGERKHIL